MSEVETGIPKDYVFAYDGEEFWVDDLTLKEAERVEAELGSWATWNPIWLAKHRLTLMGAFLGRTRTDDEVVKILDNITLSASKAMWSLRPVDLPEVWEDGLPNPGAGPSTATS